MIKGNKVDRENDRKVPTAKAQAWCKSHGDISFFEVSAKENIMIEEAFQVIAKAAASQHKEEEMYINKIKPFVLMVFY